MARDWDYSGHATRGPRPRRPLPPRAERRGRRVASVAVPVASSLVLLATTASAFWTAGGAGSGTSTASSALPLTTVTATPSTALYPGGSADLALTIRNPNPFPVTVTAVTGSGTITAAGGAGTCTITGVTFTNKTGLSLAVPAKSGGTDGSLSTSLAGAVAMDNTSMTGCQNATFTIPVTLTGGSAAP